MSRKIQILGAALAGGITSPIVGLTAAHYGLDRPVQALLVGTALATVISGFVLLWPGRE